MSIDPDLTQVLQQLADGESVTEPDQPTVVAPVTPIGRHDLPI